VASISNCETGFLQLMHGQYADLLNQLIETQNIDAVQDGLKKALSEYVETFQAA